MAAYSLWRFSKKYERMIQEDSITFFKNRKFHISQLRGTIKEANQLLEVVGDEIQSWCESIESVYSVDEFNNIFERIGLVFLKAFVLFRYNCSLKESQIVQESKERLEKILKRLEVLEAFK